MLAVILAWIANFYLALSENWIMLHMKSKDTKQPVHPSSLITLLCYSQSANVNSLPLG